MSMDQEKLRYSIFDPTGNFTALVESPVAPASRRALAAELMRRHPQLEQVGFVRLPEEDGAEGLRAELEMAGGEFCGNASMSAAALCLLRRGVPDGEERRVWLRVSGAEREVEVRLRRESGVFTAAVAMPPARGTGELETAVGALRGTLPVVRMEGVVHAIVTPGSPFWALRGDPPLAERAVRELCAAQDAPCMGLLFWDGAAPRGRLDPLVFVPGSGTLVWEKACASGSAALGMALAARRGGRVELELCQPGGVLRVRSDPDGGTWLFGRTRLVNT